MRFQLAHKLVAYLLVLSALAAVAGTGALLPSSAALFVAAAALSFAADAGGRLAEAIDRAATAVRAAALVAGALLLFRIWRRLPDSDYGPAFDLGLALLAYKLFHRRSHRDYIHLLAFSFLLVLIASTLASGFVFVAAFALYVVFAIWGLMLFYLRREMEENYLVKHSAQAPSQKVGVGRILGSRRVVGPAFFVATGAVGVAVLAGAVGLFVLLPRFGAGFVLGGTPAAGSVVAAGDEVAIGRYGTPAGSGHAVVLRATLPAVAELPDENARRAAADGLYFRGATYDVYDRGHWARSRRPELGTLVVEDADGGARRFWVHEPSEGDPHGPTSDDGLAPAASATVGALRPDVTGTLRQEIEAVGIPASVLFAVDRAVALELPAARLGATGELRVMPRWSGETALRVGMTAGDGFVTLAHAHYVAYSRPRPDAGAPRAAGDRVPVLSAGARSAYLALPASFDGRLTAVADRIAGGAAPGGEPARIAAVIDWLRAGHAYAPTPPPAPAGADPVADFLFAQPRGHCELFASGAVLLLRAQGIPARYVTGFRGGDWNGLGGYVAVRDDRAHAWAEAFVSDGGWVRVDATPPGAPPPHAGRLADAIDALDFLWSRWIVGYDLPRQRELAQRAGRRLAPLGSSSAWRRPLVLGGLAAGLAAAGAIAWVAARARWRRRRAPGRALGWLARRRAVAAARAPSRGTSAAIDRLYRRTTTRLGRAGCPRLPAETPREYARRVRAAGHYPDGDFDLLTESYAAARFGTHPVSDAVVTELAAKLAKLGPTGGHRGSVPPDTRA